MAVKKLMNTFFKGLQEQSTSGYGSKIVSTPMGPFTWNSELNVWVNMNNGMVMNNISFQDSMAMMDYDTVDGGGNVTITNIVVPAPTIVINFMTGSLGSYVVKTQGYTGSSYVGSDGYVKTTSTDLEPRFNYDPIQLTLKGLLVEGQETNYIVGSNFAPSGWEGSCFGAGVNSIALSSENAIGSFVTRAPNGLTGATSANGPGLLRPTGTNNFAIWNRAVTLPNSPTISYNLSIWAKKGDPSLNGGSAGSNISLYFGDSTMANYANATFDLNGGTFISTGGAGSSNIYLGNSIEAYPNGWYRCTMTVGKQTIGTTRRIGFGINNGNTGANTGEYIYVWGPQLEESDSNYSSPGQGGGTYTNLIPSSYIPTTTATATRLEEIYEISGTSFTSWYNKDASTFNLRYLKERTFYSDTTSVPLYLSNLSETTEYVQLSNYLAASPTKRYSVNLLMGTTYEQSGDLTGGVLDVEPPSNINPVGLVNTVFAYGKFNAQIAANNSSVYSNILTGSTLSSTGVTLPNVNFAKTFYNDGSVHLQGFTYWNTQLSSAQITEVM